MIVCLNKIRLDSYGLLIGLYRILIAAKFLAGIAKIDICSV